MKITIEDGDARINSYRKIVYGNIYDSITLQEWDYIFQHLKEHIDKLKQDIKLTSNVGIKFSLQSKLDMLEKFIIKYNDFIKLVEDSRYDTL